MKNQLRTCISTAGQDRGGRARIFGLAAALVIVGSLLGLPVHSEVGAVTDLSTVDVTVIESGDIVEALAVPRGTRITPGTRPRVRLPVYFEFNSAELRPEARELLVKVGKALTTEDLEGFSFSVEGHTDSLGGEDYNSGLSRRRAQAVKDFLEGEGVGQERLVSVGRGEQFPVDSNDTNEGRQHNRRVEIINLGAES